MNEYTASYSCVEKIVNAAQSIKDDLTCRICLEVFNEPVTIKCGHKFCKSCILQVASNENAACPFCNLKIVKRSIPKEKNELLQSCVDKYNALVEAIIADSGIDVTQPYNTVKHTKESVTVNEKLDTSKFEVASVTSFSGQSLANHSVRSKILPSSTFRNKRLSLRKQKSSLNDSLKPPSSTKNTLHKYLSAGKIDNEPNNEVLKSNEKVSNWLKNITPIASDTIPTDSNINDVPSTSKKNTVSPSENSPSTLKKICEVTLQKTCTNANKARSDSPECEKQETSEVDESKFKEVQLRIQEVETMARKKRLSQKTPEIILKTPSFVPATAHSDAGDWRRVKKVGREMQVKTFKSLHVSVEKNCSPVVTDDNNPCHSGINDNKNVSKESDTKNSSWEKNKKIKKSASRESKNSFQDVIQDYKQYSRDITPSFEEDDISAFNIDESRVKEIIGVNNNSNTSEKNKSLSSVTNPESMSSSHTVTKVNHYDLDNINLDKKPQNVKTTNNLLSSPKRNKLSLKLKTTVNSKTSSPSKTPVSQKQVTDLPIPASPERPRSRLSLRLPNKNNESPEKCAKSIIQPSVKSHVKSPLSSPVKSPVESHKKISTKSSRSQSKNNDKNNLPVNSWNRKLVSFKKLGKICKKRKVVPFLHLGKLYNKFKGSTNSSNTLVLKNIIPVNVNYKSYKQAYQNQSNLTSSDLNDVKMLSPEKDSQLKFLTLDSPDHPPKENKAVKQNVPVFDKPKEQSEEMEIKESVKKEKTSRKQLVMKEKKAKNKVIPSSQESSEAENCISTLSSSIYNKTVIESIEKKNDVPDNFSKVDLEEEKEPELMKTSENESVKSSKKRKKKLKSVEDKDDIVSISSNESEKKNVTNRFRRKLENKRTSKEPKKNSVIGIDDNDSAVIKEFEREKSASLSSSSTPIRTSSSLKKKRIHADWSSDDDNVESIIGKWCPDNEPILKKPKVITHVAQVHSVINQENSFMSDNFVDVENVKPQTPVKQQEQEPLINDINKIKAFNEKEMNANKLQYLPNSLNSADLFETNDQSIILPTVENLPKRLIRAAVGDCSSNDSSPSKNSDKENFNGKNARDGTILEQKQFKTNNLNLSGILNTSDKENNKAPNDGPSKCESNPFYMHESLINITQEKLALKNLEKDLIGTDLSIAQSPKNEEKFTTPTTKKQKKPSQEESEFETDNIDATPVVKKKPTFNFSRVIPIQSVPNENELSQPERNPNAIPAITPMKNTKSYPLCHSTPMSTIGLLEESTYSRNIILVCSGLSAANIKVVQDFAIKFRAKFKSHFSMDVTHVILNTDPEMKCGQKTSKYIQGIAFKKYVISFEWIVDCLQMNKLLDEEDKKYEVLDPDSLQNGAKKSRERTANLFDDFAMYCMEPFSSLPVRDLKNVLLFNGAVIVTTLGELSNLKDKFKLVILESEDLSSSQITLFKKSNSALVSFEWVIDCISQYSLISITLYLYETSIEEALAIGIPKYLIEEIQEEDDDE